jgi:hypothetical protein
MNPGNDSGDECNEGDRLTFPPSLRRPRSIIECTHKRNEDT